MRKLEINHFFISGNNIGKRVPGWPGGYRH